MSVEIIRFSKRTGILSKSITLDDTGRLVKDGSACQMSVGDAERVPLTDACPATALAHVLEICASHQAIALGQLPAEVGARIGIVQDRAVPDNPLPRGPIARTKRFIGYAPGRQAFALIDCDMGGAPDHVRQRLAEVGLEGILAEVVPEIAFIARVQRSSTSAGLRRVDTGEPVGDAGGSHLYALALDGADIERALGVLCQRLWMRGYGWIKLSRNGGLLIRQVADAAVGGAERLSFEGAPVLGPGLAQDAEARRPIAHSGMPLDTREALPDLSADEQAQYARLVAAAKHAIKQMAETVQAEYVEGEVEKLVRKGADRTKAREAVLSRANGELTEEDVIEFSDGSVASVAQILDTPKRYHRKSCADPVEGPEYGRSTAICYSDQPVPVINSFAHGGCVYRLPRRLGLFNGASAAPSHKLPPYYPAPTEPRQEALNRQRAVIRDFFVAERNRIGAHDEAQRRIAEALDEEADENPDAEITPKRKAAIARKINKRVKKEFGIRNLLRGRRLQVSGSQGSGKSHAAQMEMAAIDQPMTVWATAPTIAKAEEQAAEYRQKAKPGSLPAFVVRGRTADDPNAPGEKMCPRHKVVIRAAAMNINVRKTICRRCPLNNACGYLRQEDIISTLCGRAIFMMAREYLFIPSPAPKPDLVVSDEAVVMQAVAAPISFHPAVIADTGRWSRQGLDAAMEVRGILLDVQAVVTSGHPILAELRAREIDDEKLGEAIGYLDAAAENMLRGANVDGAWSDRRINEALDQIEKTEIDNVAMMLRQLRVEMGVDRAAANTVVFNPDAVVTVNGQRERQARVVVYHLRNLRLGSNTPVLLLDGTGSPELNAVIFARLEAVRVAVERTAHVTGTIGKTYSRQSLTGCDTYGNPIPSRVAGAERLRKEVAAIAAAQPQPAFVGCSAKAEVLLQPLLPTGALTGHFSALRGINGFERCASGVVVGRDQPPPAEAESLTRPFTVEDAEAFCSTDAYVLQSRGRRMRDGSVSIVEVWVHPDPRCQVMLEQIREAELVQAVDRVRPIFNDRAIVVMNDLVLDLTYDRIARHADLVAGGTRMERAWAEKGILPTGAAHLQRLFNHLWETAAAAEHEIKRARKGGQDSKYNTLWKLAPLISYRLKGQSGSPAKAHVSETRHPDSQQALTAAFGEPVTVIEQGAPSAPAEEPVACRVVEAHGVKVWIDDATGRRWFRQPTAADMAASKPVIAVAAPAPQDEPARRLHPHFPADPLPPNGFTIGGRPLEELFSDWRSKIVEWTAKTRRTSGFDGCSDQDDLGDAAACA